MKKREGRKGMQLTSEERDLVLKKRREKAAKKRAEEEEARNEQLVESTAKAVVLILAEIPWCCVDAVLYDAARAMETRSPKYREMKNRHREEAHQRRLREAEEVQNNLDRASGYVPDMTR